MMYDKKILFQKLVLFFFYWLVCFPSLLLSMYYWPIPPFWTIYIALLNLFPMYFVCHSLLDEINILRRYCVEKHLESFEDQERFYEDH